MYFDIPLFDIHKALTEKLLGSEFKSEIEQFWDMHLNWYTCRKLDDFVVKAKLLILT